MSKNEQKNELLNGMTQINSSDTITQFMEKCNNNFFIISKIGGGPKGVKGDEGGQGVPAKPKVPIHVWREGVEYSGESILNEGYKIKSYTEDLTNVKYQEGHLILLKNGHVYILEQDDQLILKPNYIISLQSYNQDDVIDGKSAYVHIAFANSSDGYTDFILSEKLTDSDERKYMGIYSDDEESSTINPSRYTWTRIIGNTGIKGDKGDKGDQGEKGDQGQKGDKGDTGAPFNGHLYTVDLEGDMSTISIGIDRTRLYDKSNNDEGEDYCQCIAHAYYGKNHVQLLESNVNVILPSDYKYLENGDIVLVSNENSKVGRIKKIQSGEDNKDLTIKFFPDSSFIFPKTSIIFKIHVEAEIFDSDNLNKYNFTRDIVWSIKGIVSTFELEIVPNYRTIKLDEFGTYFPNTLTVNVLKIEDTERSLFKINENKEFALLYKEYSQNEDAWEPYPDSGIGLGLEEGKLAPSCLEFKVVRTSGSTEDSEKQEEIWDYEDVWVVADGKSTHYYHADLGCTESMMVLTTGRKEEFTNSENKKMYCAELKNKSGYSITFDPKFYDGSTEIKNITGVSIGQNSGEIYEKEGTFVRELKPVTIDGVTKYTLTITKVPYGIDIIPMNIMVYAGDKTLTDSVSFNVYISTISDIYTLVPTVSSYNTSTGIKGDEIGCSVYKNNELVELKDLDIYGLTLNYTIHSENNVKDTKEYTEPIVYGVDNDVVKDDFTASDIAIDFILKYSGKEIVKSTVPLIKDGINGIDGDNWQYIFCRSSKYPFDQTGISNPSSWGKDEESDQDSEYLGSSESDYNTISDDKKWYDNPKGVDSENRYEYQSYRKWDKINKRWESYGEPTLYSYYSKDGKDAITYNVMLSNPVAVIPVGGDDWSVNESLNENVTTQYDSTLIYLYENSKDISKSQNIDISIPNNENHFDIDEENGIKKIIFKPVVDGKAFNFGSNTQYKLPITLRYTLNSDNDNNGQNDFFETTVNWTLNPIKGLEDVEVFVDKKIVNVSTTKNQTFQVGYDLISSNGTTHVRDNSTNTNTKNYKIFLTNDINSLNNENKVSDWSSASYDFTEKDNCYVVLTDSEPIDNKYQIIDYTPITAVIDGVDGASAIHLELTQDHIVLPCNDNGRVHGSYTGNITSRMLLYKGDVVIPPTNGISYSFKYTNGGNITTSPNGISVKTTGTNAGTITINKSIINGDTHIDCTARYKGNSYTKTLFIDLEETPYELEIDKSILTRDGNTDNINESTLDISVKYWNSQSANWVYTDTGVVKVTYGDTTTSPLIVDTNSTKKTRTFSIPQTTANEFRISYYSSDDENSKELSYETIGVVKGGKNGNNGKTPICIEVTVEGYSLTKLPANNTTDWKESINELTDLVDAGDTIYIKNKHGWVYDINDTTPEYYTYSVTSTMAGTQGINGKSRVLFYLGSFKNGTLTTNTTVYGRLTDNRCDYYIDNEDQAWMRIGPEDTINNNGEIANPVEGQKANPNGNNNSPYSTYWEKSEKVGFLQANAITADMINVGDLVSTKAFIDKIKATEIDASKIKTGKISGGNSYFNLNDGTFALGDALEYNKDGKLTIGGVNDDSANSILKRLGIVENIEIGGRNLLRYTDQSNYSDKFTGWSGTTLSLSDGWIKVTQNLESSGGVITIKNSKNDLLIKGKEYILSFDAYLENNNNDSITKLDLNYNYLMFDSGSNYGINSTATITKNPTRYSIKFTYNGENTATFGAMVGANNPSWPVYYVKNIKLEQGNKATDWTPAPEDVDAAIENAEGNGINLISYQTDKWKRATCSENAAVGSSYANVIQTSSTTKVSLVNPIYVSGNIYVKVHNSAYEVFITEFDADKLYVGKYHGWISDQVVKLSQNTKYIGVTIRKKSNATIDLSVIKEAKVKIEKGVNQTTWSSSPEDSELAISNAEALDYLKDALTDGSTKIAGGLVMTNVLMLQSLPEGNNKEPVVTAGMSGMTKYNGKKDNVLMWGGGTYADAYTAANSPTYNTGSGTITTLLKKDGTGKIGVFKIGNDKVEIEVPNQGLITIDASNSGESGICISKGSDIRTIITDLSIDDVATRRKSIKGELAINFSEKDIKYDEDMEEFETRLMFNVTGTPTAIELTSIKCKFYSIAPNLPILSTIYEAYCIVYLYTDEVGQYVSEEKITFNQLDIKDNCYECEFALQKTNTSTTNGNFSMIVINTSAGAKSTSINSNKFVNCDIEVKGKVWLGSSLELSSESIIIGNDGISCINGQSRFQIRNSNYGQIIIVDGLPTTTQGLKKGQLWNNNGVLSIY